MSDHRLTVERNRPSTNEDSSLKHLPVGANKLKRRRRSSAGRDVTS